MSSYEMKILHVLFVDEDEWQEIGLCYSREVEEKGSFVIAKMSNGDRELFRADRVKRIKLLERK